MINRIDNSDIDPTHIPLFISNNIVYCKSSARAEINVKTEKNEIREKKHFGFCIFLLCFILCCHTNSKAISHVSCLVIAS